MLTIFTTAKPFKGHSDIIQRNALKSWTLLHPEVEVILFGDDEGAAEVCKELGIRHEPEVRRHELGPKYLDYMFDRAQKIAKHDVVCYVNCDIMLLANFRTAVEQVTACHRQFLMVGRRWDTDITEPVNFSQVDWQEQLNAIVERHATQRSEYFIDYFVFSRGLYSHLPPLVNGRVGWDNYLIWKARSVGAMVVNASEVVKAVHQNHDYGYHPQGAAGVWSDDLAKRNYELAGGWRHVFTVENAPYRLGHGGITRVSTFAADLKVRKMAVAVQMWSIWFAVLGVTRPIRRKLGMQKGFFGKAVAKWTRRIV